MTINIPAKFVFIATLKNASTSIEEILGIDSCGIRVNRTNLGKHLPLQEIEERYNWIFTEIPLANFFIFSSIREPLSYLLSLYNFHSKNDFVHEHSYTKNLSFEEFFEKWTQEEEFKWQTQPQHLMFLDKKSEFRLNYLMNFHKIQEQFDFICPIINTPIQQLRCVNDSPIILTPLDIKQETKQKIKKAYEADYYFLEHMTGKILK